MKILKDMLKSSLISMFISLSMFVIVGMVFDFANNGLFTLDNHMFTKMVIACILVGLGFGTPSIIYQSEKIPLAIKTLIHLGIGLSIYFVAALNVGWIPKQAGIPACILTIVGVLVITFIIWACFMIYNKNLAQKMNEALREKNQ